MKAQLTFLSIFMKVLMLLLILTLYFTGEVEETSICQQAQPSKSQISMKSVTNAFLRSIQSARFN